MSFPLKQVKPFGLGTGERGTDSAWSQLKSHLAKRTSWRVMEPQQRESGVYCQMLRGLESGLLVTSREKGPFLLKM